MMLFKLCLKNIKKSIKDYSIYFVTLVIAVCIFYVFNSIEAQESMLSLTKQKQEMVKALVLSIDYVSVFVSVILGFLIIYSNNFLVKRRKKEIGLYLTLGMSKRKVSTILVIETLIVGAISLVVGLLLGIGLSQFISIFTARLFEADMSKFTFIFSFASLTKTILYFSIIFILVMIFNIVSLSRYKLIDLLNAKKKNEKVRVKNKVVTFITFALSIASLSYAYHILFTNGLMSLDGTTLRMLIFGAIGTFLLFLSLSGFLLRTIELNKKLYFKGLNMFTLKQINNKVNTSVISTTIISLMLLLTIGILSGSMSLASVFNNNLKENNLSDFTVYSDHSNEGTYKFDNITESEAFDKYVNKHITYNLYHIETINIDSLLTSDSLKELKEEYGENIITTNSIPIMSETDYNKLVTFYNKKDLVYDLKDDEYLVLANIEQVIKYYSPYVNDDGIINIGSTSLTPAKKIIEIPVQNGISDSNDGVIVVSDNFILNNELDRTIVLGNYNKSSNMDLVDDEFTKALSETNYNFLATKFDMEAASVGTKSIVTFLGLYLGIIFAVSSATVLAIGQLSESSDNKERYKILKQIGADNKMIRKSLFTGIAISFILPLVVALVHSYFGLSELNSLIKMIGEIDLTSNIIITTLFIVIVYGGYFFATYLCSRNIIEDKR